MNKKNLKTLIQDLEIAVAELKAEVYADPSAYIDKSSERTASVATLTKTTTTETPIDYENPWIFNGHPFLSENIDDYFGFVYCITNLCSGKRYIGRKYFYQHRKPRGKSRRVKSESDWKRYYGSSKELADDVATQGKISFKRDILAYINLRDSQTLKRPDNFLNNVLTEAMSDGTPAFYNSNILGRYMRKDYFNP